jgi:hypothetical protein
MPDLIGTYWDKFLKFCPNITPGFLGNFRHLFRKPSRDVLGKKSCGSQNYANSSTIIGGPLFLRSCPVKDCYPTNTSCDGMWRCFQHIHKLDGYVCRNAVSGRYVLTFSHVIYLTTYLIASLLHYLDPHGLGEKIARKTGKPTYCQPIYIYGIPQRETRRMVQVVDLWPTMKQGQLTCCGMCRLKKGPQRHVNIRRLDQLTRVVQARIPALHLKDS